MPEPTKKPDPQGESVTPEELPSPQEEAGAADVAEPEVDEPETPEVEAEEPEADEGATGRDEFESDALDSDEPDTTLPDDEVPDDEESEAVDPEADPEAEPEGQDVSAVHASDESADAEETSEPTAEEPTSAPTGRDRLLHALRHPARSQIVVALLLCALGFASAIQVRDTSGEQSYDGLRESELIEILDGLTGTAERARDEIERLEQTQSRLNTESSAKQAALEEAQQRARTLNIMAGLVKVTGPGLRITVTPGANSVSVGSLLDMVQELRTAGAEAIEFNNQVRVVAQSSFNSSNGVITLDEQVLEAPYVIEVIGDPHVLRTGITFAEGPVEVLQIRDGADVQIEQLDAIDIESVHDPVEVEHGTPDNDE